MIESIEIKNFQSHQGNRLVLSPGINALTGDSDNGKSAVLRALLWCVTNSPSGDAYVSDWAKTPKGKVKAGEACQVIVGSNPGDGKRSVCRVKADDFNGYKLYDGGDDCQEFSALRTDVPQAVQDAFNLGAVNIQRQMDAPFLIAETPGEAARIINGLVNLSVIDEALAAANSISRTNAADVKYTDGELELKEKALAALDWVQDLQDLADRAAAIEPRVKSTRERLAGLRTALDTYGEQGRTLSAMEDAIHESQAALDAIKPVDDAMNTAIQRINRMGRSLREWAAVPSIDSAALDEAGLLLDRAAPLPSKAAELTRRIRDTEKDLEMHTYATSMLGLTRDTGEAEAILARAPRMEAALRGSRDTLRAMRATLADWDGLPSLDGLAGAIAATELDLSGMACPTCGQPWCSGH